MWGIITTTILTSAADSLNPIGITQQFVLQGMVNKPKHIWYFIMPTGMVNMAAGYLAYYGLADWLSLLFQSTLHRYRLFLFIGELLLGLFLLFLTGKVIYGTLKGKKEDQEEKQEEKLKKIKNLSPFVLILIGIGATISELTSALPYFAFLTIIYQYQLAPVPLAFIMIIYNLIYMSPLMILYFIYLKARDRFDYFYGLMKRIIEKWSKILAPVVTGAAGFFLAGHSLILLWG